jgi:centrin-1
VDLLRRQQGSTCALIQGKITTHELKKVAKDLGEDLNDEEIEKIFVKADLDDDGFVTADDFYNILTHKVYWEQ